MSSNPVAALIDRLPPAARPILRYALYGLAAGTAAVAFQAGIHALYRHGLVELAQLNRTSFLVGSLLLVVGTAAFSSWLLTRFCPEAGGGGIPRRDRRPRPGGARAPARGARRGTAAPEAGRIGHDEGTHEGETDG